MKTIKLCSLIVSIACLQGIATASYEPHPSGASQTDGRAQQVLDRAIETLGGLERLKSINSLLLRGKGSEYRAVDLQGSTPESPAVTFHEETFAAIFPQDKILYEQRTGRHDGSFRWRRWMYAGEERTVIDWRDEFISNVRRDPSAQVERRRMARSVPHLLLLEAVRHASSLRLVGSQNYRGKPHEVVGVSLPDSKSELMLFFAADTHLLSKYEYAMDFPGLGDATVEFVYPSYRREPPTSKVFWVPTGYKILLAGKPYREIRYAEIEVDTAKAAAAFQISEQMASFIQPVGEVVELAKGVYLYLTGSLNPMFIEFKDFILAVEAPAQHPTLERVPADTQTGSTQLTERFIQKIKETIPEKPIRYLTVTHFHSDHAGGARAFLAEGAAVLTTPGNKTYFEKLAAAKYTLIPDRLARVSQPLVIETFDRRRVITDGERTVELINVGRNPHTEENVVVYLPREKILFQGDLFYFNLLGEFPAKDPSRDRVMKFFGGWLLKHKLAVERIYGFHDRGFATMTEVRRILSHKRPAVETRNQP